MIIFETMMVTFTFALLVVAILTFNNTDHKK
ncbi:putative holin-like toxin [Filibacter tadaridae]